MYSYVSCTWYARTSIAYQKLHNTVASMVISWENDKTGGNGMGISVPIVRCGMGQAVSQRRGGTGISEQTMGWE